MYVVTNISEKSSATVFKVVFLYKVNNYRLNNASSHTCYYHSFYRSMLLPVLFTVNKPVTLMAMRSVLVTADLNIIWVMNICPHFYAIDAL
jgi:hypothetical protein